jgi:hypothetical protein
MACCGCAESPQLTPSAYPRNLLRVEEGSTRRGGFAKCNIARAAPNNVPLQRGYGCVLGGASGATLSILGTIGTAVLPATALGCGIGAAAAPVASDAYVKYRIERAIFINQVVRPATNRAFDYVESWLDPSN